MLFDSDGVLVEPPPVETQTNATRAAFRAVGVEDPDRQHVDAIVGGVTTETLQEICSAYDLEPATFWAARERHDEDSQLVEFRNGTRTQYDDVAALSGLPMEVNCGVVSNNHHSTIEFVLEHFELGPFFDTYYGREMTIESLQLKKPNTHYLDRALDDLSVSAESALYIGDSESDILAAERAGLESVFVRRPHCHEVELGVEPTYEVEDLYGVRQLAHR
ncbi:HAD-superfamily hydrolase [Natrialba magadii ATCC 43099]|uniref:HAD-superfamily hydrolase n=1 Tax=Natrialba magadii (strain ATCC 43099 / DSM 3394 / CCM 3739 / CIP 104546 / IAM 13178 / JCM 8861 / NBRC 102185 / NCIMB 2190 / MS3) TaxID=547559 RepID=L9UXC7_NATMM|nr:HAD-superfamily hydrolase [Natrialba magadii ATCC 43099]